MGSTNTNDTQFKHIMKYLIPSILFLTSYNILKGSCAFLNCSTNNNSNTELSPACVSSSFVLQHHVVTIKSSEGHVGLCGTVCQTVFQNVSLIGVYEADHQLQCWCIDSSGDGQNNGFFIRYLSPDMYCSNDCYNNTCGGYHHETIYYSIYCVTGERPTGVEHSDPQYSQVIQDELLWPVVEELQKLGKETVIIVLILLSMIVVLVVIISFMYRKTLKSGIWGTPSEFPILSNVSGKQNQYGSGGYQREGKSKFYDDESENIPDEEREGGSRFYRQHAVDNKTPDKEGFSDIFNGEMTNGVD